MYNVRLLSAINKDSKRGYRWNWLPSLLKLEVLLKVKIDLQFIT
jgi:hypothetical protein